MHGAHVDAHAHRQLADVVEHREGGEQRPLRIAEERDGGTVAGIDEHALARLGILQRRRQHVVEALLEADLLGDAEARIAGDIDEQHACDERAAIARRRLGRFGAHRGVMLAAIG